MNYTVKKYSTYCESEILPLYESVGWTNYTSNPRMLERAYNNSLCIFAAYADGNVVGIVRAVGDGASIVLVQDLLVSPQYQRQGIGSALLKAIVEEYKGVYQFQLVTDNTDKNINFYKSLGFATGKELGCEFLMKVK